MKRAIGVIAIFALAGPPIGGVFLSFWMMVEAAFLGRLTLQTVAGAIGGIVLTALFSYLVAWLPALLAGVGSALLVNVTEDRRWRYAGTAAIGFAAAFGYMALRPGFWTGVNLWTSPGTYLFGALGAVAALGCMALFHYIAWYRAERPT